jgi:hypothetical protein
MAVPDITKMETQPILMLVAEAVRLLPVQVGTQIH